tara:strand:- start:159 stop:431 length:273 start_codon:yes stop_codon:yes gene_type:complete
MRIIETANKAKISHVIINKITKANVGYSDKADAEEELIVERIIWGDDNVSLVEYEDVDNPEVVDETTIYGGNVRVNNKEMIRTNGQAYKV